MPHRDLKLAVLISGGGSTLANLIERIGDGRLSGAQINQVISSRADVRGNEIARRANLPLQILRPRDFESPAAFSIALTKSIDDVGVDLVVMGGFLCLYQIPAHYLGRVINIHPALLPAYGGRGMFGHHVHEAVIAAAERESGCTVHLADNVYDHGPIVSQRRVPVYAHDTPQALADRVGQAERELYPEVIARIAREGFDWLPRISSE